jgi:hypothetical protein
MRRLLVALVAVVVLGVVAASAQAYPSATWTCNGSPCTDWFTSNVQLVWKIHEGTPVSPTSCLNAAIVNDTPRTQRTCVLDDVDGEVTFKAFIKLDKTPPAVLSAAPARSPDRNGWYRRAVSVAFAGQDATSGLAGCTRPTYAGPDSALAAVSGTCWDVAGNRSAPFPFNLRFDATAPDVTAARPERLPDHAGWYTRPVGFSINGRDTLSGLAGCLPVTYRGPDSAGGALLGTCSDKAGNSASRAFPLRYDATPPDAPAAKVSTGDRVVRLRWPTAAAVEVVRAPGRRGAASSVVHSGYGRRFTDRRVRNGRRYRYTLTLTDQAGNVARRGLVATPGPHLLKPARGAHVAAPPRLRWTRVRGAQFYNVQLLRNGHKILSAWPRRPSLQLKRSWRFGGRRQRLAEGDYRWIVWPAKGRRRAPEYGPAIGTRRFVLDS